MKILDKFVSVFEYVAEVSGIIEDGLPYVYPEDYVEYMRQANRRSIVVYELDGGGKGRV